MAGLQQVQWIVGVAKIKETDFLNAGKDIVTGLWNGITEKADWVKEKVSGFIDGIKNLFTGKDLDL